MQHIFDLRDLLLRWRTDRCRACLSRTSTLRLVPLAVALIVVAACASGPTGGTTNSSPQAALAATRAQGEAGLAALPAEPDPVLGKVRIVIPDHDRLRPFAVSVMATQGPTPPAGIELTTSIADQMTHFSADALTRTGAFQRSELIQQNDTLNPDIADADFMVWFQVFAQPRPTGTVWLGRWLVRRAGNPAAQVAALDPGLKAMSTASYTYFLKSVRAAALRLGGRTAAGAKPPTAATTAAARPGTGSGLIVDTLGHVVTNNHVVPACGSIHVFDGEHDVVAAVVAHDATNDLALLKLPNATPRAAVFRDTMDLRTGESVVVTGYPLSGLLGSDMSVTSGSVTSLTGMHDDSRMVQISAQIQPGNSGGPLLDHAGNVLGIVSSTANTLAATVALGGTMPQNVNFAIKANVVEEFLATNRVAYGKSVAIHDMSTPDIGDKARKFTVRVECR